MEKYRRKLGIHVTYANVNGKIWAFVDEEIDVDIVMDMEQQMTLKLFHRNLNKELYLVGGDFNVILSEEEKYEGLRVYLSKVEEFAHCVDTCALHDLRFKGIMYTWWNGMSDIDWIFNRLDRFLANQQFLDLFPALEVVHLIKYGSDHAPLLLSCNIDIVQIKKPFKFLNFRTKHESFMNPVKEYWEADTIGNPFIIFQSKLKKVKSALVAWSKETFRDIFKQIAALEDVIKVHEIMFELNPTVQNRAKLHKVEADYIRYYHLEEEFWRQKASMQWFKDGDRNTKFFHAYVRGKRKRLQLSRILDKNDNWLETQEDMAREAVEFFQDQFTEERIPTNLDIIQHVSTLVSNVQNAKLW
ncbi:uncharacterized protein [Nicotiana tomentosiformis]|uniref:uncharacterized protein n=1 Tax=Nicotiana tomentosiformis TaxID=4098 RepID=UPI00051B0999|nr:uncharacterized protein LOC104089217 [Nicotiana tomentosiformis]